MVVTSGWAVDTSNTNVLLEASERGVCGTRGSHRGGEK